MNCKTGCGNAESAERAPLCDACAVEWDASTERGRNTAILREDWQDTCRLQRLRACLVDFCNRVRAERQNTKPEGT
jgi:hypothetical protein